MARSFDMVAEYLGTVAQVHSAFCSKDYWLDRLAEGRADVSTLDSFAEDGHGGTDITTTQTMRAAGLRQVGFQTHMFGTVAVQWGVAPREGAAGARAAAGAR